MIPGAPGAIPPPRHLEREPRALDRAAPGRGRSEPSLHRDLRRFSIYRLLATSYLFAPIFMLFQAERGLSYLERLALGALYSVVVLAAEVPTGLLADRLGRRRAMVAGAVIMVGAALYAARGRSFAELALAEVLAALAMALGSGADSAYLHDLLASHGRLVEYPRREARASAWHLAGTASAAALGGLLATIDLQLPYLATAVVAAGAAWAALGLSDDGAGRAGHNARPGDGDPRRGRARRAAGGGPEGLAATTWASQLRAALAAVLGSDRLRWLIAYSAVVFALLRATMYIYQPYLADRGLGAPEIGGLYAAVALVAAAVADRTPALRERLGDAALLWGLLAMLAASFLGLAVVERGPWMLALLAVQAVANGMYSPLTKPLLNREITDADGRAAVLSVESMVRRAALAALAPIAGLSGEGAVLVVCGAIGLGGLGLLALRTPLRGLAWGRSKSD